MVRILNGGLREIDIDFGEIQFTFNRNAGSLNADILTINRSGEDQLIASIPAGITGCGSFIQYTSVDLDYMTRNNELLMPQSVNVQRTSPVPLGGGFNENITDQIEEYIFILSRPLNNTQLANFLLTQYESLRRLGLDAVSPNLPLFYTNVSKSWPDKIQTIYAEKRMYDMNLNNIATKSNGILDPAGIAFNTLSGMPSLANVSTWGSLGAITGPNLHCYRVVIDRRQNMIADFLSTPLAGQTDSQWPAVNISFICADPKATEGEYLTTLANAMSQHAIGGPTA